MAGQKEIWTEEETRLLVKLRVQFDYLFTGNKGNAQHGWSKIISELQTKHQVFRSDRKKYIRKWSEELIKYKNFCEPSRRHTGVGTEDDNYFGALDPEVYEILANYHEPKHNFNPPALLDTSKSTTAEHCYASSTSQSVYLGASSVIPNEYIESEVEVSTENVVDDDDDDCDISLKASSSKRCADFYNKRSKQDKKEEERRQ